MRCRQVAASKLGTLPLRNALRIQVAFFVTVSHAHIGHEPSLFGNETISVTLCLQRKVSLKGNTVAGYMGWCSTWKSRRPGKRVRLF